MFNSRILAKLLLGAVSAIAVASSANAADAVLPEAPAIAGYNWSGFYIGVGGGFGAVVHELEIADFDDSISLNGLGGEGAFGEITIGYDHMLTDRILLGAFADAHYGNIESKLDVSFDGDDVFDAKLTNKYGFDAALRLGYLVTPSTLGYVLGGYTWQRFDLNASAGGQSILDEHENRSGYVLGVGMETVLTGNWTLKSEYRYANYGNDTVLSDDDLDFNVEPSTHTFHIGANYRFGAQNGGGASFEAPAYSWTGLYVGGALGAGAVVHDLGLDLFPLSVGLNGIGGEGAFGEASIGYDHDFGGWVAGIQLDARYSGITTELDFGPLQFNVDADYGFDALLRVGAKVNESTLAYAIGGYSWQHFDVNVSASGDEESIYDWGAHGFSIGGGLETAVTNNMTANIEYRYSQYEDEDFGSDGIFQAEPSFHTVRIGAKYKFN